ncbi:MAG: hypothetical protein E7620_09560, partial [Ruminococcaceae bacterium]|nr:hypothetical protein [Oscillospiraceae bacterium]
GRHRPIDLLYGVLCSVAMILIYFVILSVLDGTEDPIPYVCKCMVCVSYVALLQFLAIYLRMYNEQILLTYVEDWKAFRLSREYMNLPWGISTIVGAVIALGIPAAMYLARCRRYPLISYTSALLFFVGALLIDTRSAILVGGIFLIASAFICCAGGPNKWFNRVFSLIIPLCVILALIFISEKGISLKAHGRQLLGLLRFNGFQNDGRHALFRNALEDFKSAPIFGVGFADGAYLPEAAKNNLFSNMYHNIVLQVLASVGLVGALGFFIHLRNVGELAVRRFTAEKLLLLFLPIMILAMSMVDNFFFYPNFQILYSIFLVLAELELERLRSARLQACKAPSEGEKPRVLFAYVEAGLGHIIPEEAVRQRFAEKYGDRAEIIASAFYADTNDPKLKKTETLFVRTVQNQNKNFIAGALCRLATLLFGDAWSLYWVMACTPSGIQSYRRALKRLKELDCHLLFTTHWSLAFYAAHLKKPPRCVLLCPDPYSNEMFNVDVNCLLLPTETGRRKAAEQRLYAGGNVLSVAPPIRSEAKQYLNQRDALRAKHGISADSFTVAIMDGGYGMARMEKTVMHLLRAKESLTLIALCGTNEALRERLEAITPPSHIRLIVLGYCENAMEYVSMADLFCGKAGANSLAEAAYFGVPILVNKCATYIERHTKNYYTKRVKGAVYLPSAALAARAVRRFAREPQRLEHYREQIAPLMGVSGEDEVADLLFRAACPAHGTVNEAKNAEPSVFGADLPTAPQNTTEVTD